MPDADDGEPRRALHFALKSYFVDNGPDRIVHDPGTGLSRGLHPVKLVDNPLLLANDPNYVNRLRASGSANCSACGSTATGMLVWKGNSSPNGAAHRHVIAPFNIPAHWTRIRAMTGVCDAVRVTLGRVVQDDIEHGGKLLPRGALVVTGSITACVPGKPNSA